MYILKHLKEKKKLVHETQRPGDTDLKDLTASLLSLSLSGHLVSDEHLEKRH